MYIDGHEREDVVRHHGQYLETMVTLRESHQPPPLCSDEQPRVRNEGDDDKKQLVGIYHYDSIYNSNEDQTWMWGEEESQLFSPR